MSAQTRECFCSELQTEELPGPAFGYAGSSSPLKEGESLHCNGKGKKGRVALASLRKVPFMINMF